jgi:hypothetical protein
MATERQRLRYTDPRGVDTMRRCIVPGCDTYVTRRRGICSEHWFMLPPELRGQIQRAARDGDMPTWIGAVKRACRLLADGKNGR